MRGRDQNPRAGRGRGGAARRSGLSTYGGRGRSGTSYSVRAPSSATETAVKDKGLAPTLALRARGSDPWALGARRAGWDAAPSPRPQILSSVWRAGRRRATSSTRHPRRAPNTLGPFPALRPSGRAASTVRSERRGSRKVSQNQNVPYPRGRRRPASPPTRRRDDGPVGRSAVRPVAEWAPSPEASQARSVFVSVVELGRVP